MNLKNTIFLTLFLSLLFVMQGNAKETFFNKINSTEIYSQNDNWELVKSENGIEVYYQTIPKDGVFQLRIKFVNKTNEKISLLWDLNKGSDSLFNSIEQTIEANNSSEKDEQYVIPFSQQDSFSNFSISYKIK